MSWIAEDPELLDFALDMLENWEDPLLSGDGACEQQPVSEQVTAVEKPPKKKKNRGRRREEILALRSQVTTLEDNLGSLKLQNQAKTEAASTVVAWENLAKRELRARRHAEDKNIWLHATLARHVKITQRLVRLISKTSSVSSARPTSEPSSPVQQQDQQATENKTTPVVIVEVIDHENEGTVEIQMRSSWRFTEFTTQQVVSALWTLYRADRLTMTHFSVEYEIQAIDETSVQSGFKIRSSEGFEFRGSQIARCSRDEATGQFLLQTTAKTVPYGSAVDSILSAAQLDEETLFRVDQDKSSSGSVVSIERRFVLYSSKGTLLQRRGLADAVSIHIKEEQQWMHEIVEERLGGGDRRVEQLPTPPQDVQVDSTRLDPLEAELDFSWAQLVETPRD